MRRRLLLVTLAVTTLLVAAFAVPLALLVRQVAHDRALTGAERDLAALAPVLATTTTNSAVLEGAIAQTETGRDGRLSILLPDGSQLGDPTQADTGDVALARDARAAFSRQTDQGVDIYTPVLVGDDETVVLRARVPDELLRDGVLGAWTILGVVALLLLAVAVVASDRLARSVTRPAVDLAATSRGLAAGDATARATVAGPPEIAAAAEAVNLLADRIDELRAAERERVADLSHRLRTPLTALRLDAEASGSDDLIGDVDRLEAEVTELIRAARRPLHEEVAVRCDLARVVQERASFWGALAADDDREWSLQVEPPGPHVVRLSEKDAAAAFDVLLGNVFAHTPDGAGYEIRIEADGDRVRLLVDDDGPGLVDVTSAISRGTSAAASTGLGLDIASSTARSAGGELRLGRSPSGGTRAELDLPLTAEQR